ncbi:epsin-3 isoform X2 [Rhododendron vialii]|uniref:epsin-3 isoform X2 n=1 Tax=Rhododendron vialii TaxID=182163 RepID=UPI0026603881|nr:epsin-3 isoform X2 [Rhododendron vialii]
MSNLGNNSGNMAAPSFHEFKKQASFFLKEKIKTARLALTDVTPAQLLTEEATNGNPWAPDTRTLKIISRAAFEVDDYWRIVEILHKGLAIFDRKNWRSSYNGLILLEHLLTHGPESVAEEFQSDRDVITEMGSFQHIDEKGFNWGLTVRKKSERILKLLEKGPLLKEERDRARKVTRGIEGFGSFCQRTSSAEGVLRPSSFRAYGRCNSQFNDHGKEDFAEDSHEWSCTGESKSLLGDEKYDTASVSRQEEDHPFCETEHQSTHSLLSTTVQHMQAC